MLEEKYDRPLVQAAKEFGISTTVFKTVCRKNGILRWPHRQIRSINRTIQALKNQATRNQGGQTSIIQDDISDLETKKMIVVVASSCNLDVSTQEQFLIIPPFSITINPLIIVPSTGKFEKCNIQF